MWGGNRSDRGQTKTTGLETSDPDRRGHAAQVCGVARVDHLSQCQPQLRLTKFWGPVRASISLHQLVPYMRNSRRRRQDHRVRSRPSHRQPPHPLVTHRQGLRSDSVHRRRPRQARVQVR